MQTVVTVALTTSVRDAVREGRSPVAVFLPEGQPMDKEGAVLCFQVTTLARDRLEDFAGELTPEQMRQVDRALTSSFGLSEYSGKPARMMPKPKSD